MPTLDQKAQHLLDVAARVFASKGYHNASMRDIARETGTSLAGIYYYFSGKEELLYSIQRHCFQQVLDDLERRLQQTDDAQEKLKILIFNHLEFFTRNVQAMKVLSHESESLTGEYYKEISAMKRRYFREVVSILDAVLPEDRQDKRQVALAFFGMVNWIYTWYDPQRDGTAQQLTDVMYRLVTAGLSGRATA